MLVCLGLEILEPTPKMQFTYIYLCSLSNGKDELRGMEDQFGGGGARWFVRVGRWCCCSDARAARHKWPRRLQNAVGPSHIGYLTGNTVIGHQYLPVINISCSKH